MKLVFIGWKTGTRSRLKYQSIWIVLVFNLGRDLVYRDYTKKHHALRRYIVLGAQHHQHINTLFECVPGRTKELGRLVTSSGAHNLTKPEVPPREHSIIAATYLAAVYLAAGHLASGYLVAANTEGNLHGEDTNILEALPAMKKVYLTLFPPHVVFHHSLWCFLVKSCCPGIVAQNLLTADSKVHV